MAIHRIAMEEESDDETPDREPAAPVGMVIQIKPIHAARSIGVLLEIAIHCLEAIHMEIQSPTILDPPLAKKVEQPQEDPKHKTSTPLPPSTKQQDNGLEHLQQEQTATLEQQNDPSQVDWKAVEYSIHEAVDSVAQVDWKAVEYSIQEAVDSVDWKEVGSSIREAAEKAEKVDWEQVRRTLEQDWAQSVEDWKSVATSLGDAFDQSSPSVEQSKHT
jgi:hypothetical protein